MKLPYPNLDNKWSYGGITSVDKASLPKLR